MGATNIVDTLYYYSSAVSLLIALLMEFGYEIAYVCNNPQLELYALTRYGGTFSNAFVVFTL